jgi:hypothetical protein
MHIIECGCECTDDKTRLLSVCTIHGQHARAVLEAAKHPRASAPDRELRNSLLCASMPAVIARLQPGDDLGTIAERVTSLIYEIQRRTE